MWRACRYTVPDYWDIGEVYERLIEDSYADHDIVERALAGISFLDRLHRSLIIIRIFTINRETIWQPAIRMVSIL